MDLDYAKLSSLVVELFSRANISMSDEISGHYSKWETHVDIYAVMDTIFNILSNKYIKTKCIFFYGSSNSGKTFLMRVLSAGDNFGVIMPIKKYGSSFVLQDLPGKDIYIMDELTINDDNVVLLLQLFEGNCFLKTDIKNLDIQHVRGKPVLCSSNVCPFLYVSSYTMAIRNRCLIIHFTKPNFDILKRISNQFGQLTNEQFIKLKVYLIKKFYYNKSVLV